MISYQLKQKVFQHQLRAQRYILNYLNLSRKFTSISIHRGSNRLSRHLSHIKYIYSKNAYLFYIIITTWISFGEHSHASAAPDLMTLPRPCTIASWSHNTSSLYCFATEAAASSSTERSTNFSKITLPLSSTTTSKSLQSSSSRDKASLTK